MNGLMRGVPLPTVSELMTADPVVIPDALSAKDAARLLEFYRVSGAPVVDEDGDVVGVVSQSNLVHAFTSGSLLEALSGLCVRDLMSRPAITVRGAVAADEAARLMEAHHVHRLVVVAADERTPIGILSQTDLVRALAGWDD
jgi:predicted transcriptional regulator